MGLLFEQSRLERVRTWAIANKQRFRPNGFGRQFALLQEFPDVPDAIWDIKCDVVAHFGLHDLPQEPLYRDLCGVITEGGAVHPHRDSNQGMLVHTRFNVMVSRPDGGGVPMIDGMLVDVPEGGIFRVDAGLRTHSCTPVIGARPRIILSFGFLSPLGRFSGLPFCISTP
ncbi:hypothetical protein WL35_01670 [Burkholderia ubonensis]|uniref:hypothetical protein n=1 Tax=Burkholderia ubonensis TaxID=101571 RepID=UPI0007583D1B|nr:hypothetical protein WJ64_20645 [Burkholderia ubonensis]KWB54093.1 hypothetical protein WL35_01670 [Burkholderia ubonensis]KWC30329.1 hypothetical protein WL49_29030 [Burkholderia ubonensis]KWC34836.1 hypothetical protein WL48_17500 [Burkholderia ubonensis]OJA82538.1 hypothetical protein BGV48_28355 [Burkholderia ubonensis]